MTNVRLDHCIFLNRTRKPPEQAALFYYLQGQAYLNFIDREPDIGMWSEMDDYLEIHDMRINALEFGGPTTYKGLNEKRQTCGESLRPLQKHTFDGQTLSRPLWYTIRPIDAGRRSGLKIRRRVSVVRVRVPSPACQLTLSASLSGGARGVNALLVFVGGGIGSLLRYGAQLAIGAHAFPVATLVVNVAGSFLIGCLGGFGMRFAWWEYACLFLTTGLCGGFTTFSTFSRESLGLLQSGAYGSFALYAMGSVALGIAASVFGFWVAR